MIVAALLFVGPGRTAHSFSVPQPDRADVRGEMANLLTTSLTSDRFGVNDSSPGGRFIPAFFEEICLDYHRRDLSFSGPSTLGAVAEARPWELLRFSDWCS